MFMFPDFLKELNAFKALGITKLLKTVLYICSCSSTQMTCMQVQPGLYGKRMLLLHQALNKQGHSAQEEP